jgi:hypothetical protein
MSGWADFATALLPGVAQTVSGHLQSGQAKDQQKLDYQLAQDKMNMEFQLAMLKNAYAPSGGGGGGGGGGPSFDPRMNNAQMVAAKSGIGDNRQRAIENALAAMQNVYAR